MPRATCGRTAARLDRDGFPQPTASGTDNGPAPGTSTGTGTGTGNPSR